MQDEKGKRLEDEDNHIDWDRFSFYVDFIHDLILGREMEEVSSRESGNN